MSWKNIIKAPFDISGSRDLGQQKIREDVEAYAKAQLDSKLREVMRQGPKSYKKMDGSQIRGYVIFPDRMDDFKRLFTQYGEDEVMNLLKEMYNNDEIEFTMLDLGMIQVQIAGKSVTKRDKRMAFYVPA
jgi:hypothetical protein